MVMHDMEAAIKTMNELHGMGVHFAIDDFGTGYSSLSHLKRFPVDKLKIDKSFIDDIETDLDSQSIAKTIITLGHSLDMQVVAEGVETIGQMNILNTLGCDIAQGYYYSRPLPAAAFAEWARLSVPVVANPGVG